MLSRTRVGGFAAVLSRNMATEKQLKTRMNGTKNIAKITKSMKMVRPILTSPDILTFC